MTRSLLFAGLLAVLSSLAAGDSFDDLTEKQSSPWMEVAYTNITGGFVHREKSKMCVFGDKLYIIGGRNAAGDDVDLFHYIDFTTMTYAPVELHPTSPRPGPSSAGFIIPDKEANTLYLVGGKEGKNTAWRFDIALKNWTQIASDNDPHYLDPVVNAKDFAAVSVGDYIIAAGTKDGEVTDWKSYSKMTDTWMTHSSTNAGLEDPAIIAVGDMVYMIGGSNPSQFMSENALMLDTTKNRDKWEWVEVPGVAGEEYLAFQIDNDLIAILGDPGGKGELAANNGIAFWNVSEPTKNWTIVDQYPGEWIPILQSTIAVSYRKRIIIVGCVTDLLGNLSTSMQIFDPTICPLNCNNKGSCELGNCICDPDSTGIACENTSTETDVTTIIIIVVLCGTAALLIGGAVVWRQTAEMRRYRKLFSASSLAEDMAEQIASMELESLDYLMELENPSKIQKNFQTIIKWLKLYRSYLPETVLNRDSDTEETPSRTRTPLRRGNTSRVSVSSNSTISHSQISTTDETAHQQMLHSLNKVSNREIAILSTNVENISTIIHPVDKSQSSTVETTTKLIDIIHHSVQSTRGIILSFTGDTIVSAWNFQLMTSIPESSAVTAANKCRASLNSASLPFTLRQAVTRRKGLTGNLGGSRIRSPVLLGNHIEIANMLIKVAADRDQLTVTDLRCIGETNLIVPVEVVEMGGYHAISGSKRGTPSILEVYTIDSSHESMESEWMYELGTITAQSHFVFQAIDIYRNNGPQACLSHIKTAPEDSQQQFVILRESLALRGIV
eukprot:TRINITY_DN5699_c0_g1_i2.p1 TRINITY_DN5699_c0_g1~~TRINITY_DN5699_c0_g1_i2.p1  ORF type:complete len:782 (+),score=144.31 TRINITY_DN5699_c0_g1_i2:84-2429(+)